MDTWQYINELLYFAATGGQQQYFQQNRNISVVREIYIRTFENVSGSKRPHIFLAKDLHTVVGTSCGSERRQEDLNPIVQQ